MKAPTTSWPFPRSSLRHVLLVLFLVAAGQASAQERLEREGIVLFWGMVPAAIASQKHAQEELHGGPPPGGGKVNHLVVAVFDAKTGRRIENAVVRAQLVEPGIADAPPKYLPPMTVNGLASYGQLFGMVYSGPSRFKVWVKLEDRPRETVFDITATPQLAGPR